MKGHYTVLQSVASLRLSEAQALALAELLSKVDDWDSLLAQAELYGVSNLLLMHVDENALDIPKPALLSLRALSLRHRSAAAARYELICDLSKRFENNGIPFVALKGLALVGLIYPSDELRPMRDMDILVPVELQEKAADVLKEMGFEVPEQQPSKFMRWNHQLPNATKTVNGFTISVEIHIDALTSDVRGRLRYHDVADFLTEVKWRDLSLTTLNHERMLHQLCRHLEGLHPGAVLKLVNVLDIVEYSETFVDEINWPLIKIDYSHVTNTLRCVSLITPLSKRLSNEVGGNCENPPSDVDRAGVGKTMLSLTRIFRSQKFLTEKLKMLFLPSTWWLHLYYNVDPQKSLVWVQWVRHPLTVAYWLSRRLVSRLLGG